MNLNKVHETEKNCICEAASRLDSKLLKNLLHYDRSTFKPFFSRSRHVRCLLGSNRLDFKKYDFNTKNKKRLDI